MGSPHRRGPHLFCRPLWCCRSLVPEREWVAFRCRGKGGGGTERCSPAGRRPVVQPPGPHVGDRGPLPSDGRRLVRERSGARSIDRCYLVEVRRSRSRSAVVEAAGLGGAAHHPELALFARGHAVAYLPRHGGSVFRTGAVRAFGGLRMRVLRSGVEVASSLSVMRPPRPAAGEADVGLLGESLLDPIQDVAQCRNELANVALRHGGQSGVRRTLRWLL